MELVESTGVDAHYVRSTPELGCYQSYVWLWPGARIKPAGARACADGTWAHLLSVLQWVSGGRSARSSLRRGHNAFHAVQGCGPDIHVNFPKEERIRFVIDTLARFIIEDGTDMEQLMLEAEADNPEFEFLRDVHCPEHMYYRWKLYSLCNDDSMAAWRTCPFVMIEESNRIHPPPLHSRSFQKETAAQRGTLCTSVLQLVLLVTAICKILAVAAVARHGRVFEGLKWLVLASAVDQDHTTDQHLPDRAQPD